LEWFTAFWEVASFEERTWSASPPFRKWQVLRSVLGVPYRLPEGGKFKRAYLECFSAFWEVAGLRSVLGVVCRDDG
jgi:hypothetical protein